jgi:hypothetical protein
MGTEYLDRRLPGCGPFFGSLGSFVDSRALDGSSTEEGGGGELGRAGPVWDVESGLRVRSGVGGVEVMILKGLLDAVARILLLGAGGAFPVKEKSLSADGTVNIGRAIRQFAQNLHVISFVVVVRCCRPVLVFSHYLAGAISLNGRPGMLATTCVGYVNLPAADKRIGQTF